jgi:hypothetical protein
MKLLIMQFSPTSCQFISSSLFGPNTLLNTLFSNTRSLCSSLNVRDQVSHPYHIVPLLYSSRSSYRKKPSDIEHVKNKKTRNAPTIVETSIVGGWFAGPYVWPHRLNGAAYRHFWSTLWFMHMVSQPISVTPPEITFETACIEQWIERQGPITWPSHSPFTKYYFRPLTIAVNSSTEGLVSLCAGLERSPGEIKES